MKMTVESKSLARISAYLVENKIKSTLEKERLQYLACEAKEVEDGRHNQITTPKRQRLDCIYDNECLGFKKNPSNELQKMQAQEPLKKLI